MTKCRPSASHLEEGGCSASKVRLARARPRSHDADHVAPYEKERKMTGSETAAVSNLFWCRTSSYTKTTPPLGDS